MPGAVVYQNDAGPSVQCISINIRCAMCIVQKGYMSYRPLTLLYIVIVILTEFLGFHALHIFNQVSLQFLRRFTFGVSAVCFVHICQTGRNLVEMVHVNAADYLLCHTARNNVYEILNFCHWNFCNSFTLCVPSTPCSPSTG